MYLKKQLLILLSITLINFYHQETLTDSNSEAKIPKNQDQQADPETNIPKCQDQQAKLFERFIEAQEKQNEQNQTIIALLATLASAKEQELKQKELKRIQDCKDRLASFQAKQAALQAQQKARQQEAEKGFSFTDCGIVIRDTFFDEFSLRRFSLEFSELLVKNFKTIVMKRALSQALGVPDVVFGDLPSRYGYKHAAVYPMTFLETDSFAQYLDRRQNRINKNDPEVIALHQQADDKLKEHEITQAKLDAQKRLEAVDSVINEQSDKVQRLKDFHKQMLSDNDRSKAELEVFKDLANSDGLIRIANIFEQKQAQAAAQAHQRNTSTRVSTGDDDDDDNNSAISSAQQQSQPSAKSTRRADL